MLTTTPTKKQSSKTCKVIVGSGKVTLAFFLSAPTAAQNFLGELGIDLGSIKSWDELFSEVKKHQSGEIVLATGSMTNSLVLNMAVNYLYFGKSIKETGITFLLYKDWMMGKTVDKIDILLARTPAILGGLVAFLTYYALGSTTFPKGTSAFTKGISIYAGVASGTSFFITRFNGVKWLLSLPRKDQRLLRHYSSWLRLINTDLSVPISGNKEDALKRLLQKAQTEEIELKGNCLRFLAKLPTVTGVALGSNALLVQPVVAYDFLTGGDILFRSAWFSQNNYQGIMQLILAHPLSLVNSVFFLKAAILFPGHLVQLAQNLYKLYNANKGKMTMAIAGIAVILALGAWSGQGFGGVAKSAYDAGVLDYITGILSFLKETVFQGFNWMGAGIINADAVIVIVNRIIEAKLFDPDTLTIEEAISMIESGDSNVLKVLKQVHEESVLPMMTQTEESPLLGEESLVIPYSPRVFQPKPTVTVVTEPTQRSINDTQSGNLPSSAPSNSGGTRSFCGIQ